MSSNHQKSVCAGVTQPLDLDGFIFDLDDTLYGASSAYEKALNFAGVIASDDDYIKARQTVKAQLGQGHPASHNRLLYFKSMADAMGSPSPENILHRMQLYEDELARCVAAQWRSLNRGALFEQLRYDKHTGKRRRCLILTNENTRTQLIKWRAIDPTSVLFDGLISSEEIGVEKPDVRMFQKACEQYELNPQRFMMVGDHPQNDLLPAQSLGMKTMLTHEFAQRSDAHGAWDYTVSKLDALKDIVR
jgi:putative hydrolase of the HAD superfamily